MAPTPGLAGRISALVLADLEDNVGGHPMPSSRAADTSCQMGSASAPLAHPMASSSAVNSSTELYPVPVRWSSYQPASAASAAKQKLRDTPSSSSCFAAIPRYWGTAILFTQPAKVTQSGRLCGHVVLCSCLKDVLLCRGYPCGSTPKPAKQHCASFGTYPPKYSSPEDIRQGLMQQPATNSRNLHTAPQQQCCGR